MGKTQFNANKETGELKISRFFNAGPEKVWRAYTNKESFESWWGPKGWETTTKEFNVSPGGKLHYCMKCVDKEQGEWYGQESWGIMEFTEVNPITDMTYMDYFADSDGKVDESMPAVSNKLELIPENGGTKLVSTSQYKSAQDLQKVLDMGMEEGYDQTLDCLEEFLAA